MSAVSNASPLIALAGIQRLDLLPALFKTILIPPAVSREIRHSIPLTPQWLQAERVRGDLPSIVLRRTLGDGEREAIALALEIQCVPVILDDLPARRIALAAGLNVIGTIGVLLGAKRLAQSWAAAAEMERKVDDNLLALPSCP